MKNCECASHKRCRICNESGSCSSELKTIVLTDREIRDLIVLHLTNKGLRENNERIEFINADAENMMLSIPNILIKIGE